MLALDVGPESCRRPRAEVYIMTQFSLRKMTLQQRIPGEWWVINSAGKRTRSDPPLHHKLRSQGWWLKGFSHLLARVFSLKCCITDSHPHKFRQDLPRASIHPPPTGTPSTWHETVSAFSKRSIPRLQWLTQDPYLQVDTCTCSLFSPPSCHRHHHS
jgi:hypothetical protein